MFDLTKGKITVVVCPTDLRSGFFRLASISRNLLGIDILKGDDWVIFLSKSRRTLKMIHSDKTGTILVTRTLKQGCFQQLLCMATGPAVRQLTPDLLMKYLNGDDIDIKRTAMLKG